MPVAHEVSCLRVFHHSLLTSTRRYWSAYSNGGMTGEDPALGPKSLLDICITVFAAQLLVEYTAPLSSGEFLLLFVQNEALHLVKLRVVRISCHAVQELPGPDIAYRVSEAFERCSLCSFFLMSHRTVFTLLLPALCHM